LAVEYNTCTRTKENVTYVFIMYHPILIGVCVEYRYIIYLKMMLELERFLALGTFELAEYCALVVTYHVPLETVHVGERLVTHFARL